MRIKATLVVLVCGFFACMQPTYSQAAPSVLNQSVARNLAESLRAELMIADQDASLSPVVNSTYVLIEALEEALNRRDSEAMRCAVEQYAGEVRSIQDAAVDPACLLPLVASLNSTLTTMLGIVSGGGTPLCIFLNLSNALADFLTLTVGYQICVIDGDSDPLTDNATLVQKQHEWRTFGFTTSVLNLIFCKRPVTSSDIAALLFEFIGLMPRAA